MRFARGVATLVVAAVALGCASRAPDPDLVGSCTPQRRAYPMPALTPEMLQTIAGSYRLVMVARTGEQEGGVAHGTLHLQVPDSAHRHLGHITGRAIVDLSPVSVRAPQRAPRADAEPWILGFVDSAEKEIELTLEAPRAEADELGERIRRVGTFLRIRQANDVEIRGVWSTGQFRVDATGYFCGTRTDR